MSLSADSARLKSDLTLGSAPPMLSSWLEVRLVGESVTPPLLDVVIVTPSFS
jgi:hypothetical protein